ncbi:hypothetical protein KSX_84180 [Ktedonospora formicarum]|uniref:ABC transporter domain-containing protein n=1 Tax=Ktedonospora formicarum TaxID=2778364 RepID=A0A8J3MZ04_9CHLR|nr:ABC transporter ATP-binding protein [Ktedonospora formicarum]GHO50255.1 hypothetical protein KSX_84180 [Ktedonospora formicarum]
MFDATLKLNRIPNTIYRRNVAEIEVQSLAKRYGKFEAVKSVTFGIHKGEIFGLLGPNGAGKSTVINMMCGYLQPSSGDTYIRNYSVKKKAGAVKYLIGVVPQELALYSDLSALENLIFFGKMYGIPTDPLKKRAAEVLNFVGLYDRRKDSPKHFSGVCSVALISPLP